MTNICFIQNLQTRAKLLLIIFTVHNIYEFNSMLTKQIKPLVKI